MKGRGCIVASLLWAMTTPAFCDSWTLRPGLWERTFTENHSGMTAEMRARIEELDKKRAPPKPLQFCPKADSPVKSIFDPANQPPGTCTEEVLSESATDREVEDVCMFPATGGGSAGPGQAHRHIILAGDGAGTIDRADVTEGPRGVSLTIKFRWLGPDCGTILPAPN